MPRRRPPHMVRVGSAIACAILATGFAVKSAFALVPIGAKLPGIVVEDAWERPLDLRTLRGKPVVVVVENKDAKTQNLALKRELAKRVQAGKALRDVRVIAIADLRGYGGWPIRGFARDAVRKESSRIGAPIYCDFSGAAVTTFDANTGASNVVIFDRAGKAVWASSGPLDASQRARLFLRLEEAGTATSDMARSNPKSKPAPARPAREKNASSPAHPAASSGHT